MSLEHAKKRVYEDFAKTRARIERMKDGQQRINALKIWHLLAEFCM